MTAPKSIEYYYYYCVSGEMFSTHSFMPLW